jgi:CAAX prenyl protease-like protein
MRNNAVLRFVAPFAIFIVLLSLKSYLPIDAAWEYAFRCLLTTSVLIAVSLPVLSWRSERPFASMGVGLVVFLIWIGPDLLWSSYRDSWLFQNAITGTTAAGLTPERRTDVLFIFFRGVGSVLLVPVIEELFWRGWLMRYIINPDFEKVPLGTYSATAMWATAALFAVEHGPFWDVGLAAGLVYNWWLTRTRNLTDCMIAHAATNAALAAYVLHFGEWQYWL